MKSSWVRRPITGLGVFSLAIALTVTLPVWAVLTMLVDAVRGRWRFPIPRLIAFATCWAWLETSGLVVALFLFFTGRGRSVPAHYALQTWWCRSLIQALGFTVGLQITVEGAEHVGAGPFIALGRHASLPVSRLDGHLTDPHVNQLGSLRLARRLFLRCNLQCNLLLFRRGSPRTSQAEIRQEGQHPF